MIRVCASCGQKNRVSAAHLSAQVRCGKCKTTLGPIAEPIDADEEIFNEVVGAAAVPVLVDFWAAWCGPCVAAAPEVKKVAAEAAGRAVVLKVDTDRHQQIAARYGVRGIPNFVVLRGGKVVHQHAGVVPHTEMLRWLMAAGGASATAEWGRGR
jgi:thioredoxin 2